MAKITYVEVAKLLTPQSLEAVRKHARQFFRPFPHPAPEGEHWPRGPVEHGRDLQLHHGGLVRGHQHGAEGLHPLQHGRLRRSGEVEIYVSHCVLKYSSYIQCIAACLLLDCTSRPVLPQGGYNVNMPNSNDTQEYVSRYEIRVHSFCTYFLCLSKQPRTR